MRTPLPWVEVLASVPLVRGPRAYPQLACRPTSHRLECGLIFRGVMRVFTKKCVLFLGLVLALTSLTMAQGVEMRVFTVGTRTIGWFANTTGQTVTGLRIAFDEPVTLTGKIEVFGGLENVTGADEGTEFLFVGKVAPGGFVELRWEPTAAGPVLVMWMSGDRPVGRPFFATVPALIKVISGGLVALRDTDPTAFTALLTEFFNVNTTLAVSLGQLGLSPEILSGMLMVAPAEGVENLLLTLVSSFGLDTVEKFMGALDWSLIFTALGI